MGEEEVSVRALGNLIRYGKTQVLEKKGQDASRSSKSISAHQRVLDRRSWTSRRLLQRFAPVAALKNTRITLVAAGYYHTLLLDAEGNVLSFGLGLDGQLGHGSRNSEYEPRRIRELSQQNIACLAGGARFSAAMTRCGKIYTWGTGEYGELGIGNGFSVSLSPEQVLLGGDDEIGALRATSIAAGAHHTIATVLSLKNTCSEEIEEGGGEAQAPRVLAVWGRNESGQLGTGERADEWTPRLLNVQATLWRAGIRHIDAGQRHSALVTHAGDLWTWGCGRHGQLCHGENRSQNCKGDRKPRAVERLQSEQIKMVACGLHHTAVLTEERKVFVFGGATYISEGQHDREKDSPEEDNPNNNRISSNETILDVTADPAMAGLSILDIKSSGNTLYVRTLCGRGYSILCESLETKIGPQLPLFAPQENVTLKSAHTLKTTKGVNNLQEGSSNVGSKSVSTCASKLESPVGSVMSKDPALRSPTSVSSRGSRSSKSQSFLVSPITDQGADSELLRAVRIQEMCEESELLDGLVDDMLLESDQSGIEETQGAKKEWDVNLVVSTTQPGVLCDALGNSINTGVFGGLTPYYHSLPERAESPGAVARRAVELAQQYQSQYRGKPGRPKKRGSMEIPGNSYIKNQEVLAALDTCRDFAIDTAHVARKISRSVKRISIAQAKVVSNSKAAGRLRRASAAIMQTPAGIQLKRVSVTTSREFRRVSRVSMMKLKQTPQPVLQHPLARKASRLFIQPFRQGSSTSVAAAECVTNNTDDERNPKSSADVLSQLSVLDEEPENECKQEQVPTNTAADKNSHPVERTGESFRETSKLASRESIMNLLGLRLQGDFGEEPDDRKALDYTHLSSRWRSFLEAQGWSESISNGNFIPNSLLYKIQSFGRRLEDDNIMLEIRRSFHSFDKDQSGEIDHEEMHEALQELGCRYRRYKVKRIIKKYDRNGNGTIAINEFLDFCHDELQKVREAHPIRFLFRARPFIDRTDPPMFKPHAFGPALLRRNGQEAMLSSTFKRQFRMLPRVLEARYFDFVRVFMNECVHLGIWGSLTERLKRQISIPHFQPLYHVGYMDLNDCDVNDQVVEALVNSMKCVPIIRRLDLRNNKISGVGAERIASLLEIHDNLADYVDCFQCRMCLDIIGFENPRSRKTPGISCPCSPASRGGHTYYLPVYWLEYVAIEDPQSYRQRLANQKLALAVELDLATQLLLKRSSRMAQTVSEVRHLPTTQFRPNVWDEIEGSQGGRAFTEEQFRGWMKRRIRLATEEFFQICAEDLSREVKQREIRRVFAEADKDQSGYLDKKEVVRCFKTLGIDPKYVAQIDTDGNGLVTLDEFELFCLEMSESITKQLRIFGRDLAANAVDNKGNIIRQQTRRALMRRFRGREKVVLSKDEHRRVAIQALAAELTEFGFDLYQHFHKHQYRDHARMLLRKATLQKKRTIYMEARKLFHSQSPFQNPCDFCKTIDSLVEREVGKLGASFEWTAQKCVWDDCNASLHEFGRIMRIYYSSLNEHTKITQFSAGCNHALTLTGSGLVWVRGFQDNGRGDTSGLWQRRVADGIRSIESANAPITSDPNDEENEFSEPELDEHNPSLSLPDAEFLSKTTKSQIGLSLSRDSLHL